MEKVIFWENIFFIIAFTLYILSAIYYFYYFLSANKKIGVSAMYIGVAGLFSHTLAILLRTIEAGRMPLSNQFEFANVFVWGIVLCYLFLEVRYKLRYQIFGVFVMPLALIVMGYALTLNREILPLMPALQSWWLTFHVGTAIFAYGSFTIACGVAIMYLYRANKEENNKMNFITSRFPRLAILDDFIYKTVAFGFLFQTLVIITGAVWAEQAWGRYWGWDPKETWSLITWFIYAVYLHARFTRGWAGKKSAWFAVIGFICVLFTYIGVNILLPGLHSYV